VALLGLLALPFVITIGAAAIFKHTITMKEALMQLAAVTVVMVAGFFITRHFGLADIEHLHGRLTAKLHGSEKCCHCRQVCDGYRDVKSCSSRDSKGNCSSYSRHRECTGYHEECDHSRDYWWSLQTTVGRIPVDDCDPSESSVPGLWSRAVIGEPATVEHEYQNYLKADPESLLVHNLQSQYLERVPAYPDVYDLYKVDPVISDGAPFPPAWQVAIRDLNADLGVSRQVDLTVLLTRVQDPVYAYAVEAKWLYGPKNSVTLVLGVRDGVITWARVVTVSRVEDLKIFLRDELQGKRVTDDIPGIVRAAIHAKFHRTPMAEFEYLARGASPPTGWLIFLYVLGVASSCALSAWLHREDVFGEAPFDHFNRYNRSFR
jgi:hypothetical protein